MLKMHKSFSRFSDGPVVNAPDSVIVLRDLKGEDHIGTYELVYDKGVPTLIIKDIMIGAFLAFQGDYDRRHCPAYNHVAEFENVSVSAVLYQGTKLPDIEAQQDDFVQLIFLELLSATLQTKDHSAEQRAKLKDALDFPAFLYAYSFEIAYAILNGNRDVISLVQDLDKNQTRQLIRPSLIGGTLDEFWEQPSLRNALTRYPQDEDYTTPEAIRDAIQQVVPLEVMESQYQQFLGEVKHKEKFNKTLPGMRDAIPRETLEVRLSKVKPHLVRYKS